MNYLLQLSLRTSENSVSTHFVNKGKRKGRGPRGPPPSLCYSRFGSGFLATVVPAALHASKDLLVAPVGFGATELEACQPGVKIVSAAAHFHGFGVARQGPWVTVEKVGVGPVGGPREPENKAKTLRKRRIQPLNRGQKRARRGFSTGWLLPGSPVDKGRDSGVTSSPLAGGWSRHPICNGGPQNDEVEGHWHQLRGSEEAHHEE